MVCDEESGNTSVHLAFYKDNLTIIILILQYGADIYKYNNKKQTPLDLG